MKYIILNRSSLLGRVNIHDSLRAFSALKAQYAPSLFCGCSLFDKISIYATFKYLNRDKGPIEHYRTGKLMTDAFIDVLLQHAPYLAQSTLTPKAKCQAIIDCWNAMIGFDETRMQWFKLFMAANPEVKFILVSNTNQAHDDFINAKLGAVLDKNILPTTTEGMYIEDAFSYIASYMTGLYKTDGMISDIVQRIKAEDSNADIIIASGYTPDLDCAEALGITDFETGPNGSGSYLQSLKSFDDMKQEAWHYGRFRGSYGITA